MDLVAGVGGEGIVLKGVEFGNDLGPGHLFEAGDICHEAFPPGEGGGGGDADGRGDEDEACRGGLVEVFEGVVHGEGAAGGVADHVEGFGFGLGGEVFHGEIDGGGQVFPGDGDEAGGRGAVTGVAESDDPVAVLVEGFAEDAEAVGGVRHAVEEEDAAPGMGGGQFKGAVPVGVLLVGVGEAAGAVSGEGEAGAGFGLVVDALVELGEEGLFECEVVLEGLNFMGGVLRGELGGEVFGVPDLEGRAAADDDDVEGEGPGDETGEADGDVEADLFQEAGGDFLHGEGVL